jgi:hypothetical protein
MKSHVAMTAGVLLGSLAFAGPTSAQVIDACVNTTNGMVRIVDPDTACRTGERALQWNVQGVKGDKGDKGVKGDPCDPGGGVWVERGTGRAIASNPRLPTSNLPPGWPEPGVFHLIDTDTGGWVRVHAGDYRDGNDNRHVWVARIGVPYVYFEQPNCQGNAFVYGPFFPRYADSEEFAVYEPAPGAPLLDVSLGQRVTMTFYAVAGTPRSVNALSFRDPVGRCQVAGGAMGLTPLVRGGSLSFVNSLELRY